MINARMQIAGVAIAVITVAVGLLGVSHLFTCNTQGAIVAGPWEDCSDSDQVVCEEIDDQDKWQRWEKLGPGGGDWFMHQAIGPDGSILVAAAATHGSVVAFHYSDPDIFFAGARGGIY